MKNQAKSMSKNITLNFQWDKDTYMEAGELAYDYKMNYTPKKYMGWLFIALLQFGVVGALLKGTLAMLLFSTILLIYWYYLKKIIEKKILLSKFEKEEDANKKLHVEIKQEQIEINGKKIPWSDIPLIISSIKGYLVDCSDGFLFFPGRAFQQEEDKTEFIKIAKNNGVYIQRISKTTNKSLVSN